MNDTATPKSRSAGWKIIAGIGLGMLIILGAGGAMFARARAGVNHIALTATPKLVTVIDSVGDSYRPTHRYIGTIEPWVEARIGPQLVSAYVETVLVRPGAVVKRGEVLATLDCRTASASMQAISAQARALATTQAAVAKEASRVSSLLDGGYASPNEVEQKEADSQSKQAQLLALQAQIAGTSLQVSDCVLKAPFDGEIADRQADPGAFVRPGSDIATLVDRGTVRVVADVPEDDFQAVAPGTPVRLRVFATGVSRAAKITRRAPSADPGTRTVHVEIDLANDDHSIPVGTTADIEVDVGEAKKAIRLPLAAATVRGDKANVFVVENGVANKVSVAVLGERGGDLFIEPRLTEPKLGEGAHVVVEGRNALVEGDRVETQASPTKGSVEKKAALR